MKKMFNIPGLSRLTIVAFAFTAILFSACSKNDGNDYVQKGYNIQSWKIMPEGGHFAAMEQPELLSKDMISFFKNLDDPDKENIK